MNIALQPKPAMVRTAVSKSLDPAQAAQQLYDGLFGDDCACVVFFCSVHYELEQLSHELSQLFGDIELIGCTTAGEVSPLGYLSHSITGFSLGRDHFSIEACLIKNLASFSSSQVTELTQTMMHKLSEHLIAPFNDQSFALTLLDGLSIQQEEVLQALDDSLNNIPLVGGSAGDDLLFRDTHVYYQGEFHSNAAVIVLLNTDLPFEVVSAHHLKPDTEKLVVTKADPFTRKVLEINAEPAALEYCRVMGLQVEDLSSNAFALNPLAVQMGQEMYVRSVQKLNEDMSLTFFCAVDVGVVLTKMHTTGIIEHTQFLFSDFPESMGELQLVIAYDCIYRRIEAEQLGISDKLSDLYQQYKFIGFNTYGEQHGATHVNDTLSCIVIGSGQ